MDKQEKIAFDAEQARQVATNPQFIQAMEDVRAVYLSALEMIPTTEDGDDQAKDVRRKLAALSDVRSMLNRRIDTGKLSDDQEQKRAGMPISARQRLQQFAGNLIAKPQGR